MSVEKVGMTFQKVNRSYYSTANGWRLATFEEATNGLKMIKEQNLLDMWDRARLLDGWITGPGYNFQMGNDFKGCLGYMLLIHTEATGCAYDEVMIEDSQKEVALLLCADDCNYEVVYWLFNSWAKTAYRLDLQDVIQGKIPFSNPAKFKQMNSKVGSLARKLGAMGPVSEKAAKTKFLGSHSVKNVLSEMIKIANEDNLQPYHFTKSFGDTYEESCFPSMLEPDWLQDFGEQGGADWNNIADAIWNFLSESYAESMFSIFATIILTDICELNDKYDLKTITSSQKNFVVASFILFYLCRWRTNIIHTSLAHGCERNCAVKMICQVALNCGSTDLELFNQELQNNLMWRRSEQIGNYDVLNKLLVLAASGHACGCRKTETKTSIFEINRLLDCGAQVGPAYAILGCKKLTALGAAVRFIQDDDIAREVAKSLLDKCNGEQQLASNPNEDEYGLTPLHFASQQGRAEMCKLLFDYGAEPDVRNNQGQTALHFAVEGDKDAVVNVFMEDPHINELVDLKDKWGDSPIDTAVAKKNTKLVAMLLFKSKNPEAYFDKVGLKQLLRHSLLDGSVDTVRNLFEKEPKLAAVETDDEGKTALHFAAMCKDDSKAMELVGMVLKNIEGKEHLVANQDKRGRTALNEAALNGNEELCKYLLDINPKIINLKDRDGRNPIYDAAKGNHNKEGILKIFLDEYSKKNIPLNTLIDRNGLTPLHVAASLGKKDTVRLLLSWKNIDKELKRKEALEYLKRSDFLGQTALHKAANCGDSDTVNFLLNNGAHPLEERDCDGRTALHYAVEAKTRLAQKMDLVESLLQGCRNNEEKLLLLWASAAGLGTADHSLEVNDELHKFLVEKKNEIKEQLPSENLLKAAISVGDIEMTKELIARGYRTADIHDTKWRQDLTQEKKENVKRVSDQLERIAGQWNDQPTVFDNLGRIDYAQGLAILLLNPYIKPPIVVGISGSWGMGKSSLMAQTESILLKTAAQMALLPSAQLSSSASELPEITTSELSEKGKKKYEEIKRYIDFEQKERLKRSNGEEPAAEIRHKEQDSLEVFLNNYQPKHRKIFKSLAAMDSSDMFTVRPTEDQEHQNPRSKSMWRMYRTNYQGSKSSPQQSTVDSPVEESIPAVLTVQYNAWKYRNETEALAGMAVEITKELEGIMTQAQWLSTCWRNTWKKKKYNILIEIIYPCLLAVVLACTITWILWVILDRSDKFKHWAIPKYACLPTGIIIIGWSVTKSVMGILKPVSTQLMRYISFPDHTEKLGYQERVISDIIFLKDEIGKRPCMVFKVYSWLFTVISTLWLLFFEWFTTLFFHSSFLGKTMVIPKIAPALGTNLRIVVFIDDLDRCQESVILQVLSAINLVLAVCEINVVLGIDKGLIERAIIKKYGDMKTNRSFKDNQELADKYLQKIIQLPLDLPDPGEEQSRIFLEGQLGVFQEPSERPEPELKPDAEDGRLTESTVGEITESETRSEVPEGSEVAIDMPDGCFQFFKRHLRKTVFSSPSVVYGRKDETKAITNDAATSPPDETGREGDRNYLSWIPLRELLLATYSKGEQDAFCYFQKLATDTRKLPREWKRNLTYHRLVWNIFYLTKKAKGLPGWQVQLITWIFVCWEWQENMNIIIQNWNEVGVLKTIESKGPSLHMIVDHFIDLESKKHKEQKKLEEDSKDIVPRVDAEPLEETLRKELDELKKEIKDLKALVMKQHSMKNEKREKEKKMKLKRWQKLRSALDNYDVPMDGILAFQRFRFYCIAGHLSWPLPEQDNNEH